MLMTVHFVCCRAITLSAISDVLPAAVWGAPNDGSVGIGFETRFEHANIKRAGQADAVRHRQGHGIGVDTQCVGEHRQRQHYAVGHAHEHEGAMAWKLDFTLPILAQGWINQVEQGNACIWCRKSNLLVNRGSVPIAKIEVLWQSRPVVVFPAFVISCPGSGPDALAARLP